MHRHDERYFCSEYKCQLIIFATLNVTKRFTSTPSHSYKKILSLATPIHKPVCGGYNYIHLIQYYYEYTMYVVYKARLYSSVVNQS